MKLGKMRLTRLPRGVLVELARAKQSRHAAYLLASAGAARLCLKQNRPWAEIWDRFDFFRELTPDLRAVRLAVSHTQSESVIRGVSQPVSHLAPRLR